MTFYHRLYYDLLWLHYKDVWHTRLLLSRYYYMAFSKHYTMTFYGSVHIVPWLFKILLHFSTLYYDHFHGFFQFTIKWFYVKVLLLGFFYILNWLYEPSQILSFVLFYNCFQHIYDEFCITFSRTRYPSKEVIIHHRKLPKQKICHVQNTLLRCVFFHSAACEQVEETEEAMEEVKDQDVRTPPESTSARQEVTEEDLEDWLDSMISWPAAD